MDGSPPYQPPPRAWPYGPGRPGSATAAAVLGLVTGGLGALFALSFLASGLDRSGDAATAVLGIGGLPCAAGMIAGGVGVLRRRPRRLLVASAALSAVLLVLVLVSGLVPLDSDDGVVVAGFVVVALPLPIVTACLAGRREIADWISARSPHDG